MSYAADCELARAARWSHKTPDSKDGRVEQLKDGRRTEGETVR